MYIKGTVNTSCIVLLANMQVSSLPPYLATSTIFMLHLTPPITQNLEMSTQTLCKANSQIG